MVKHIIIIVDNKWILAIFVIYKNIIISTIMDIKKYNILDKILSNSSRYIEWI